LRRACALSSDAEPSTHGLLRHVVEESCKKTGMTLEQVTEAAAQVTAFMEAIVEAEKGE
jgi:hypothetical protein